jgi:hypothetical protein
MADDDRDIAEILKNPYRYHPRLRVSDVVSGHKAPGRAYNFYSNKLIFAAMIRIGRTGMRRHMESKEEQKTAAARRTRRRRRKFRMSPCRATACAVTAG